MRRDSGGPRTGAAVSGTITTRPYPVLQHTATRNTERQLRHFLHRKASKNLYDRGILRLTMQTPDSAERRSHHRITRPYTVGCKLPGKAGLLTRSRSGAFPVRGGTSGEIPKPLSDGPGAAGEEHTAAVTVADSHGVPFSSPRGACTPGRGNHCTTNIRQ